jgi:type IV pilus assembly protein PilY1
VDVNADGMVDYFFAGDLQGSLWRFDVTDTVASGWSSNKVFTARDAGGNLQPISSAPGVARDPSTNEIWVFFGTGRYMTADDQASTSTHTYYGVKVGTGEDGVNLTRSNLQQRSIHLIEVSTGRRAFEPHEVGVDAGKDGWFIDLNDPSGTGERVISAPLIYDNILIFSSIVPPTASTVNSCDAGGTGYINALDAFSGTSLTAPFFNEPDPTLTDDDDNELPIGSLPIEAGMPTAPIIIGNQLVVGDSSGGIPTSMDVNAPGGSSTRRVSWRELLNDQ